MKGNKDILAGEAMRKRSYSVPSDYFEGLQDRLMCIPQEHPLQSSQEKRVVSLWQRMRPYAALAASFALIFAIGSLVLGRPAASDVDATYESLLFADMIPHVDPYLNYGEIQDEPELSSEEILDYLVFSNVQPDPQDLIIE